MLGRSLSALGRLFYVYFVAVRLVGVVVVEN